MLELKNIYKYYQTGSFKQMALDGLSLKFRQQEMVSILGPSGCGKTTLLNIIGGLDRYTSGDLIINGKSTKDFKDVDWDAYRNNSIGFVFQSYNLINHISVLNNVELAMTLSGTSVKERKEKASLVLGRVGLSEHVDKLPTQLSGGQKQRVAIARAIVNNPDIILMDEPTGALDSKTSVQILDLVKEVAHNKLVIMVTHNPQIAEKYSSRLIKLRDGVVIDDTKPYIETEELLVYQPQKTSMNFFTALKLSFNNLRTKFTRSLITSIAASIGIIGVALVLAIANGFSNEVQKLERETLSGMPISVNQFAYEFTREAFEPRKPKDIDGDFVYPYNRSQHLVNFHQNILSKEYLQFLDSLENTYYESISYVYNNSMFNLLYSNGGVVSIPSSRIDFTTLPNNHNYILTQFDLIAGRMPSNGNEVILVTDQYQRINERILDTVGIEISEKVEFNKIIGQTIVAARNNAYYEQVENIFAVKTDLSLAYQQGFELEIVGIIKAETEIATMLIDEGIAYHHQLAEMFLEDSMQSDIVSVQKEVDYHVLTGKSFNPLDIRDTKENALQRIGGNDIPISINIYAKNFDAKEILKQQLDLYNVDLPEENQIIYSDLTAEFTNIMSSLVTGISIVLIAFASISLVVSSIMIGIITYVSVLERTKEIGVLRSLGARKKDISRVFNAETIIIGFVAGVIGVAIALVLTIPINILLTSAVDGMMTNMANLGLPSAVFLIIISIILTLISGLIPSRMAAKKDPVEALRVES